MFTRSTLFTRSALFVYQDYIVYKEYIVCLHRSTLFVYQEYIVCLSGVHCLFTRSTLFIYSGVHCLFTRSTLFTRMQTIDLGVHCLFTQECIVCLLGSTDSFVYHDYIVRNQEYDCLLGLYIVGDMEYSVDVPIACVYAYQEYHCTGISTPMYNCTALWQTCVSVAVRACVYHVWVSESAPRCTTVCPVATCVSVAVRACVYTCGCLYLVFVCVCVRVHG